MARTTYATILYGLEDVSATEDGIFSSDDKQSFTNFNQLIDESSSITPIQTCEPNIVVLDGTSKVLDTEAGQQYGYYSGSISDEDGNFETNPKLARTFERYHSTPSIIFYFGYEGRPKQLKIKYYRNNTVIAQGLFDVDADIYTARKSAKQYDKFEIEFIGTYVPNRYIKLAEIFYGEFLIWDRENVISANTINEFDLLSNELPIGELEFSIYDENNDFNILNPQGMYEMLQQKQKILVTETINGVEYSYGTYYLDTWESTHNKVAKFVAKDGLSLLDDIVFKESEMYNQTPIANVIADIMEVANFGNYQIRGTLANEKLSGYIPVCTCREALQYVLLATNSNAFCDFDGVLVIQKLPLATSRVDVEKKDKWETKITQNDVINSVIVEGYTFEVSSDLSDLYTETLQAGNYEVQLSEPATNIVISANATITDYGINYVAFTVNTAGEVKIQGNNYVKYSNIALKQTESIAKIKQVELKDNYLIDTDKASDVAEHIYNYYQKRLIFDFNFINSMENLAENVTMELELEQTRNGMITKMDTDLSSGFISQVTVNEV